MIPALLPLGIPANVQNVALHSKKAPLPIIGHLMENSIVYPAVNLSIGSSSLLLLMKMFTRESATLMPANNRT